MPWPACLVVVALVAVVATSQLPEARDCHKDVVARRCGSCHVYGLDQPGAREYGQTEHMLLQMAVDLKKAERECDE